MGKHYEDETSAPESSAIELESEIEASDAPPPRPIANKTPIAKRKKKVISGDLLDDDDGQQMANSNSDMEKKPKKKNNKLRNFLATVESKGGNNTENDFIEVVTDNEEAETDHTDEISLYSNMETKENLIRRNSSEISLSDLEKTFTSDTETETDNKTDYIDKKYVSDTEYNTKKNRYIAKPKTGAGNNLSVPKNSKVSFGATQKGPVGQDFNNQHQTYDANADISQTNYREHEDAFGTMTDNLHISNLAQNDNSIYDSLPNPASLNMQHSHYPANNIAYHNNLAPELFHHNDIFHMNKQSVSKAQKKFSVHHNPYKRHKKLNDFKPARLYRQHSDPSIFGEIDLQQVKRNIGMVEPRDIFDSYNNPEAFDGFYSETEDEPNESESVYYYSYDTDESGTSHDSFDSVLRKLHALKLKKQNQNKIHEKISSVGQRKTIRSRNSRSLESISEAEPEDERETAVVTKSTSSKGLKPKPEKSVKAEEAPLDIKDEVIPDIDDVKSKVGKKKDKKNKKGKKKDKKKSSVEEDDTKPRKGKVYGIELDQGQSESKILDFDKPETFETGDDEAKKGKKDKKKSKKNKKKEKKKDKKKKTKRRSSTLSESDAIPKSDQEDAFEQDDDFASVRSAKKNSESNGVQHKSVERIKQRIDELKKLAEEEEALEAEDEGEDGPMDDLDSQPAAAAADEEPMEDEGPEPQIGIQYDPERQICLGDPIKVGTTVWAVDFAYDRKFKKGKIVAFTEPATYTVKFGMFRKQPGTQRLDIVLKQPKSSNRMGFGLATRMFKSTKDIYKACEKGDVQAVLDNILKNPDIVEKPGGKLKEQPLYYAAKNGHEEIVKLLMRYGANDENDGRILKDADPAVRDVLLNFGWGRTGAQE